MEDNLLLKRTFDGKWSLMEDYLLSRTTFDGRWPGKTTFEWKMTFNERWPLMEDNLTLSSMTTTLAVQEIVWIKRMKVKKQAQGTPVRSRSPHMNYKFFATTLQNMYLLFENEDFYRIYKNLSHFGYDKKSKQHFCWRYCLLQSTMIPLQCIACYP